MSLDFYNSSGRAYAYTNDGEHLYTYSGRPIAYLSNDSVYSYSGKHLGYFNDGIIRDSLGNVLLFTSDARGGPIKPIRQLRPVKSVRQLRPLKSLRSLRPIHPIRSLAWSELSPEEVFE